MAAVDPPAAIPSPYRGLTPYSEADAAFFFGRDRERQVITVNLMASRLTLLYGASGVGKSSLLRAGVARHIRDLADLYRNVRGAPEYAVVVFSTWRDNPLPTLAAAIEEAVAVSLGIPASEPPPNSSLAGLLRSAADRVNGEILLIFDQFEEYFLYHPGEDGPGTFAGELIRCLNVPDLPACFLLAVREDAFTQLDRFKGRIRNLFDNYLRIEHLTRAGAEDAIRQPLEVWNRGLPTDEQVKIEDELVNEILDQTRTGSVTLGAAGIGQAAGAAETERRIETPFLQMVLTKVWETEMREGSRLLRLDTFQNKDRLGGAQQIVRSHLNAAMDSLSTDEQSVVALLFSHLVTPSGSKIAHSLTDLSEIAHQPPDLLQPILERLSGDARILRHVEPPPDHPDVPSYEIFHDVLAGAVLDWRKEHDRIEAEREAAAQKERAEKEAHTARRLLRLSVSLGALVLISVGLSLFALYQRSRAEHEYQVALAHRLVTKAEFVLTQGDNQLPLSTLLAVESLRHAPTADAEEALHKGLRLLARRVMVKNAHKGGAEAVAFSRDGRYLASSGVDGDVQIWIEKNGTWNEIGRLSVGGRAIAIAFSPDGNLLAASADDTIRLWRWRDHAAFGSPIHHADTVKCLAFSPDGNLIVSGSQDGAVWLTPVGSAPKARREVPRGSDGDVSVAFSSDGKYLAVGRNNRVEVSKPGPAVDSYRIRVSVWRVADLRRPLYKSEEKSDSESISLAFSPNGAVLGWTNKARIMACEWRTGENGSPQHSISTYGNQPFLAFAFSPDGTYIATSSQDGTARIWRRDTGDEVARMVHAPSYLDPSVAEDSVEAIAFQPTNKHYVATACQDGSVILWDWHSRADGVRLGNGMGRAEGSIPKVACSPGGRFFAKYGGEEASIWDARTGELLRKRGTGKVPVLALSFRSEDQLVLFTRNGNLLDWNWRSDKAEQTHYSFPRSDAVTAVDLNPGRHILVMAFAHFRDSERIGTTRIWQDWRHPEQSTTLPWTESVRKCALSPDGLTLATCSNTAVRLWRLPDVTAIPAIIIMSAGVSALAFDSSSSILAVGDDERNLRFWERNSGVWRESHTHRLPLTLPVQSIAFRPNARDTIAVSTGTVDNGRGSVEVWQWRTQQQLTRVRYKQLVSQTVFASDGFRLASAINSGDGFVDLWLLDRKMLVQDARWRLIQNLSYTQWLEYVGSQERYRPTCPDLPVGRDTRDGSVVK